MSRVPALDLSCARLAMLAGALAARSSLTSFSNFMMRCLDRLKRLRELGFGEAQRDVPAGNSSLGFHTGAASRAPPWRCSDEVDSEASGEYSLPRGTLVMTTPNVFGRLHVVPVVNEFPARFPQIDVHLTLSDRTVNIVDEHIDLAVRVGVLPDSTLIVTKVGEIRRVMCGSPDHFAAHCVPKTPDDLADHMCITFTALASAMTWIFNPRGKATTSVRPYCRLKINTADRCSDCGRRLKECAVLPERAGGGREEAQPHPEGI